MQVPHDLWQLDDCIWCFVGSLVCIYQSRGVLWLGCRALSSNFQMAYLNIAGRGTILSLNIMHGTRLLSEAGDLWLATRLDNTSLWPVLLEMYSYHFVQIAELGFGCLCWHLFFGFEYRYWSATLAVSINAVRIACCQEVLARKAVKDQL